MKILNLVLRTIFLLAVFLSCEKEEKAPIGTNKAIIGRSIFEAISYTTATVSSTVESIKGNRIIEHGHCWGTCSNPLVEGTRTKFGSLTEAKSFSSHIENLLPNSTYYVRSYLITEFDTIYGEEISIETRDYAKPNVATAAVSGITPYFAVCGGNVTDDGGLLIKERGVVWSTTSKPTITNKTGITTDGDGIGSFTSQLFNLEPSTTYCLRAYATNNVGTNYGNELVFRTKGEPTLASLTTNIPSDITFNSVILGGIITNDGNETIIACGVCYSTRQNPTIADFTVTTTVGFGSFSVSVSRLSASTTYYSRAYATNSKGTAYGNEVSFKTLEAPVTDIDGNIYHTITIGTQVWMVENLKTTKYNDGTPISYVTNETSWRNLSTGAYCWYNNDANFKDPYGALYNWYAVNTGKLAPMGWHVPSDAEWTTLTTYLGGERIAGGKLKEVGTMHWISPNTCATNETGFSALPGGRRGYYMGTNANWWCSTEENSISAWIFSLRHDAGDVQIYSLGKQGGLSIRCIKDY